jgi:hypothetical protein
MKTIKIYLLLSVIIAILASCDYDTGIRDAEYPDQALYMPAAYQNGLFVIDDITRVIGELPFEGSPYRYKIDTENRQFIVPLSVYRAGIDNKEEVSVTISIHSDTVSNLNNKGSLGYHLLVIPDDKIAVTDKAIIKNNEEIAIFDLKIDLDFLISKFADQHYGIGVNISSQDREVNPKLATTVVIINTKIMKSTADFTYTIDGAEVRFRNTSTYAEEYVWDFGDASSSTEASPTYIYASPGKYKVSLTSTGITGKAENAVYTEEITIE